MYTSVNTGEIPDSIFLRVRAPTATSHIARSGKSSSLEGGRSLVLETPPTSRTYVVRRGSLTKNQRLDYIKALKCIHTKPSTISKSLAPGARNRYDDFQAIHIKYTTSIHATGNFFAWHRWFVYIWEKALRDECGFTGCRCPVSVVWRYRALY